MKKGVPSIWRWRIGLVGLVVASLALSAGLLFFGGNARAAGEVKWINRYTVLYEGVYFQDANPGDLTPHFTATMPDKYKTCTVTIAFIGLGSDSNDVDAFQNDAFYYADGNATGNVDYDDDSLHRDAYSKAVFTYPKGTLNGNNEIACDVTQSDPVPVNQASLPNRKITFIKLDDTTIVNYRNNHVFKRLAQTGREHIYRRDDQGTCADMIVLPTAASQPVSDDSNGDFINLFPGGQPIPNQGNARAVLLYSVQEGGARTAESYTDLFGSPANGCGIRNDRLYDLNHYGAVALLPRFITTQPDQDSVEAFIVRGVDVQGNDHDDARKDDAFVVYMGTPEENLPKDANGDAVTPDQIATTINPPACKGGSLGWILCPMVNAINEIAEAIKNAVASMLAVNPLPLDTDSTIYQIWENMRNFANIAFVIVFMIVIFSQATSIGLSNYGIKSLLPRLIAVAILSNLSYYICSFMIDIFNILGVGIENLFAVVNGGTLGSISVSTSGAESVLVLGTISGVIAATIYTGAIVNLFPFLVAAFFAVLLVFVILLIRQILIILLVAASPLILIAAILPGTRRAFSAAFSMFTTLLFMYPLLIGIFAAGRVASSILTQLGGGGT